MHLPDDIKANFNSVYSFATQISESVSGKYPSVVFIALVGAWARGIPSDEDIDFVIASTQESDLSHIFKDAKSYDNKAPLGLRTTFICYPFSSFENMAFRNSSKTSIVKISRLFRTIFRKLPFLKILLIKLLGPHKQKFQKYEILPQTIQTYIPFFDRDNTLALLQAKQRAILELSLTESDLLLYSQNGFRKLMEHYLSDKIDKKITKTTLASSDIDWIEYLNRAIEISGPKEKTQMDELRTYALSNK